MPVTVVDNGKNNYVGIAESVLSKGNARIILDGDGNSIIVDSPPYNFGGHYHLVGGADVQIGAGINASQIFVHATSGSELKIGEGVGFNGAVRLLLHEPGKLSIGDGCLFAAEVDATISDMHSIIDVFSRMRLNPPRNISIGNRVWVGQRCMILKGVTIGEGSVIGAGSIVTKSIPANCAAAGNPARLVKQNVTWDVKLL